MTSGTELLPQLAIRLTRFMSPRAYSPSLGSRLVESHGYLSCERWRPKAIWSESSSFNVTTSRIQAFRGKISRRSSCISHKPGSSPSETLIPHPHPYAPQQSQAGCENLATTVPLPSSNHLLSKEIKLCLQLGLDMRHGNIWMPSLFRLLFIDY